MVRWLVLGAVAAVAECPAATGETDTEQTSRGRPPSIWSAAV